MKKLIVFVMLFASLCVQAETNIKQAENLIKDSFLEILKKEIRDSNDIPIVMNSNFFDFMYNDWCFKTPFDRYQDDYPYSVFKSVDIVNQLSIEENELYFKSFLQEDVKSILLKEDSLGNVDVTKENADSLAMVMFNGMRRYKHFHKYYSFEPNTESFIFFKIIPVPIVRDGVNYTIFIGALIVDYYFMNQVFPEND